MEFKNLIVYQKALEVKSLIESQILSLHDIDKSLKDQLRRASQSIILNIAEGSSRFSPFDRKNFYVIARGSAFECAAVVDIVGGGSNFDKIRSLLEEISKILFKMISTLNSKIAEIQNKVK